MGRVIFVFGNNLAQDFAACFIITLWLFGAESGPPGHDREIPTLKSWCSPLHSHRRTLANERGSALYPESSRLPLGRWVITAARGRAETVCLRPPARSFAQASANPPHPLRVTGHRCRVSPKSDRPGVGPARPPCPQSALPNSSLSAARPLSAIQTPIFRARPNPSGARSPETPQGTEMYQVRGHQPTPPNSHHRCGHGRTPRSRGFSPHVMWGNGSTQPFPFADRAAGPMFVFVGHNGSPGQAVCPRGRIAAP